MSLLCAPGALYTNLHSSGPWAHCVQAPCPHISTLKDDQDDEHALHSPGGLSTWLVARAQKMFTEQHWVSERQPDYRNALSDHIKFTISNGSSISKIFSNGIKDLQMKEKVSLFFPRCSLFGLYNIKRYFFKVSFLFLRLEGYFC